MKFVIIAFALAGLLASDVSAESVRPQGTNVVVRGEGIPRPVQTPLGVVREDELDPSTGIPVAYERERLAVQGPAESNVAPDLLLRLPLPQAAEDVAALQEAVNNLSLAAALQRSDAEVMLRNAGDVGLAALIQWGLYHELPSVRAHSAELLGTWGGQRVLKYLIEAFYSAAYPTIAPYQVRYVATLDQKISQLTGQDYSFPVRRSGQAPEVANQMVLWWNANYGKLPPQLGEPALNANHPQFEAWLREVRSLTLQRRDFEGSNLPEDIASPPLPTEPAGQRAVDLVPTVSGNFGIDRNVSTSLTPSVLKNPAPQRDAPGDFRRRLYEAKLRGEQ